MKHKFGFIQLPDERDNKFPLSKVLGTAKPKVESRVHKSGSILNQLTEPSCVGHACQQLLASEPVPQKGKSGPWLYAQAKKIDEFGPSVEGTSIRAGMNVLKENGLIEAYFWARTTQQVIDFLLRYGPVVAGTPWLSGMNTVPRTGIVSARGANEGGHAYLIVGANTRTGLIHCVNSWGIGYGQFGHFSIRMSDFDKLLARGQAAAAIEPDTKL